MAHDPESVILSLETCLDTLKDGSTLQRGAKKKAIENVKQIAFQDTIDWPLDIQSTLFDELLDPIFLWSTADIEYIREKAVLLLDSYVERVNEPKYKVVETCLHRFPNESTEEIRQVWMNVALTMLNKVTKKLKPPMDDIWFSLATLAVKDPYPQVIQQGADLVITLATLQPEAVGYRGEHTIINSVIPLLTHKHTAIRILGTKAMYKVLLCSSQGTIPLSDVFPKLIHDHSASVRASLFAFVGDTLINWAPTNRYSHADRLLPVLFAGAVDELDSISECSRGKLNELGRICSQDLVQAGIADQVDEAHEVDIGLKHLVHQCYDDSIKRFMNESNDFIASKKATSLSALCEFLVYVSPDDLVRSNKWVIQRLMMIMAGPATTAAASTSADPLVQQQINRVVCGIGRLLSWPILLDQLLPRLSKASLMAESSHLPASTTVSVIMDILLIMGQNNETRQLLETLSDRDRQRIKTTIKSTHLTPYLKSTEITTLVSIF